MCESNEVGRLNQLGFVGMQKEVEGLLSYKARNSDPLRVPNYYNVLYSWYISRGDYRSGESCTNSRSSSASWGYHVSTGAPIWGKRHPQDIGVRPRSHASPELSRGYYGTQND
jgi:hypothetical protein